MIAFLHGVLASKDANHVVIDVSGVGYMVEIPPGSENKLPDVGLDIKFYTHYHIREKDVKLYGFWSLDELKVFTIAITVKGIGPALALNIVSKLTPSQFRQAILAEDHAALIRVPRLNKQSAQLVIMTLKKKITQIGFDGTIEEDKSGKRNREAIQALIGLGGSEEASEKAVVEAQRVLGDEAKIEDLTLLALRYLNKFS
ncbi:TPA: Holliday junction branch migration protein RuvA [Candidatus Poribacteria bacterium]|jgi:Holliday junction DNA helicase RuvA|nr:Holliday junction branch migration protein RuvA [Candidatus Poribacteria bacterium]HIA67864.1 Holliday junction branch migration protein RuvA [Candidatus Poribacteria bacterium]HIC00461.1 Holliday junction branch migration protein RuvA [Candidatus Poribacteria bacterium]HIC16656.1 Holliday junction branch migration protein RuvA [Candidatus Poribacteria bacterium]HIN30423.1 Holliday junction branch migration protein RuvA [Candidatus Poribacteria bacterium]